MTRCQEDDIIFTLYKTSRFLTFYMHDDPASAYIEWAYQAIKRYIRTGRAYLEWEQALAKANPEKLLMAAYRYAVAHDGSDDSLIKACTAYLKRYCGLKAY